jgi:hypothetical protein
MMHDARAPGAFTRAQHAAEREIAHARTRARASAAEAAPGRAFCCSARVARDEGTSAALHAWRATKAAADVMQHHG